MFPKRIQKSFMSITVCFSCNKSLSAPCVLSKVADRLFSSFGQDILDALYWTATEPKERKRDSIGVIPHFFMAVFYVCILPGEDHTNIMFSVFA